MGVDEWMDFVQYVQGQYAEWMETLDSNLEKQVQMALLEFVGEDVVQLRSDPHVLALFKEVGGFSSTFYYFILFFIHGC